MVEEEARSLTEFNMSVAELQAIDAARRKAHELFLEFRYDARKGETLLDCLKIVWLVVEPLVRDEKNSKIYGENIKRINELFERVERLGKVEFQKGWRKFNQEAVVTRPSDELFKSSYELFRELYLLKQRLGLGFTQRFDVDFEHTWKRAAE